jgi:hypothetical protein
LDVRRDKRERAAFAAANAVGSDPDEDEEDDEDDQDEERITARVLSIWKSWMNSPKTDGTVANDARPCCGVHVYAPRTTAKDIAITFLPLLDTPAGDRYPGRVGHGTMDGA